MTHKTIALSPNITDIEYSVNRTVNFMWWQSLDPAGRLYDQRMRLLVGKATL